MVDDIVDQKFFLVNPNIKVIYAVRDFITDELAFGLCGFEAMSTSRTAVFSWSAFCGIVDGRISKFASLKSKNKN